VVLAIKYWPSSPAVAILSLTVSIVIFGALSVRYGDEFWHRVGTFLVRTFRM
jgi:hypothetical protein